MKVAIIHDWLIVNGGAEKVLKEIITLYPGADIYTLVNFLPEEDAGWLNGCTIHTSFIQDLLFSKTWYRNYFPLFPFAIEQFDMSSYDLVISSSYSVAKGVITGPNQTHICYCHSPARYAWDLQHEYLKEANMNSGVKSFIARYFLHKFRIWDTRTSNGVDLFFSNSNFIKARIKKCYGRLSETLYPPVDIARFVLHEKKGDYYLAASRLVPYKRIDLIVSSFQQLKDKKLIVIGDGPEMKKIAALAKDYPNIKVLGYQDDVSLLAYMSNAKAFVFAAEEDFGIMPVEAQATGTPVLAFGKGGSLETVVDGVTGLFFSEQSTESIIECINRFEQMPVAFNVAAIRTHSETFSDVAFREKLRSRIALLQLVAR
ncbi:glycosyltransferase family 4 protein [Rheinheimera sp. 1928-s]|uniref:glycosyltransferase family 4 protein n=1 Tax=Rheinheimera sp. 1928-s TaxID=3033803 RepID=UPI002625AABC|nr:glycosyltransferase family 4 protein [Rheinheimera sp. 1928-s]MDF3125682.1 glycosyltransferase family 4 protein [Rheinheimera sp. 1928-s]